MLTTDPPLAEAAADAPATASLLSRATTRVAVGLITIYQRVVSPWLPDTCRFEPSCSHYAREAFVTHGPLRGAWLAARRIGRCHPLGGQGYDPVPGVEPRAGRKS